jgi:hypothetical protein
MEVTTYCEKLAEELNIWKGKVDYIATELDKVAWSDKERILPETIDLLMFIEELRDRIDNVESNCPEVWEPGRIGVIELQVHKTGNWGEEWEKNFLSKTIS